MVFVDCRLTERKTRNPSKTKVSVNETSLLSDLVKKAIRRFVASTNGGTCTDDDTEAAAYKRVKSVSCNGCDLTEYQTDPDATLSAMNSSDTPIFKKGIDIMLTPN